MQRTEDYDSVNEPFAQDAFHTAMYLRLEKIDPTQNRWSWYVLSVQPTLFGEWAFSREWGRIGEGSGQAASTIFASEREALTACDALKASKTRRGYITQPEQIALPL